MKVGSSLPEERAIRRSTFFGGPVSLKPFLHYSAVLSVIVAVHLDVARGYVDFITVFLDAMVVRLFFVVRAVGELVAAIVQGAVAHESVLERFVALFVPLEVADHFFFFDENSRVAVEAVEMFSV